MDMTPARLERAYQTTLAALLAERNAEGHWTGELSTSALSTATAVAALALVQKHTQPADRFAGLIRGGLVWLAEHQNADGGWGDTLKSFSNISTTMLCRAAFHLANGSAVGTTGNQATGSGTRQSSGSSEPPSASRNSGEFRYTLDRAEDWLGERYGRTAAEHAEAVRARYGKDRTFAVPILTTCALAGLTSWKEVPSLPFELACFPQSWFRFLNLQVVSYALPALIAIGQAVYHHRPPWNPIMRFIRWLAKKRSLKVLEAIQPSSGGYLEAAPLTSFVTLSLASIGLADHAVAKNGVRFLVDSVRPDGSWPIDTNLATWVTTLSINALATAGAIDQLDRRDELRDWLLNQQYSVRHPYTGADPGGWAWTNLPGGVPDADDTPGAVLALQAMGSPTYFHDPDDRVLKDGFFQSPRNEPAEKWQYAVEDGVHWLVGLQNSDCGWPTFCRGWGHLPFDRSGNDLTAHAIRAIHRWNKNLRSASELDNDRAWERYGMALEDFSFNFTKALAYLSRQQRPDGSWLPLWFGNQHAPDDENPTYGTAKVLAAYRDLGMLDAEPARRGIAWLLSIQNADGGWGGAAKTPSSLEETALAVEILLDAVPVRAGSVSDGTAQPSLTLPARTAEVQVAVNNGLAYLVQQVEAGGLYNPAPIGFYFAKLWYFEKLYPIIFTLAALGRAVRKYKQESEPPT